MADATTRKGLEPLKWQVIRDLGYPPMQSEAQYRQHLDRLKYDVARQIGVPLQPGYNGNLPSRDAGAVGGRIGGPIGGNMVRRMIAMAEQHMAQRGSLS
ncbi:MAG: alpha/beta-type small acid-soluble spore protein [Thermaerobacter sp.]